MIGKREIKAIPVKCNNVEMGCTWVGTVGTLEEHVATCNRDYSCKHCGEKGTYASIQVHDKTCEKKEVTCPKDGCCEKIQRELIKVHILTTCEHAIIPCKYIHTGCEVQLKRKDMAAHELDYEAHFKAALDTINLLRQESHSEEPSLS